MGRKRRRTRNKGESGGTISRRTLLLLAGGGAVGATGYFSSGAFDSVVGDRAFGLSTSGDDTALLGIDIMDPTDDTGERVTLFELTNQFNSPLETVQVDFAQSGQRLLKNIETPAPLDPNESGPVTAELTCSTDRRDEELELEIFATSSGESVTANRTVRVTCLVDPPVCAPRDIPGCVDDEIPPWEDTDCSVVINASGEKDETIDSGIDIGGAVDITTDDEVTVTHHGSVTDYFRIDTSGETTFSMSSGSTIGGPLQLSTTGEVTADLNGSIGEGVCAEEAGKLDVSVDGGSVNGPMSLGSSDEVSLEIAGDSSIEGDLTIRTDSAVEIEVGGSSTVSGDVLIDTGDEVSLEIAGDSSIEGDLTIRTDSAVEIEVGESSTVSGDVLIDTGGEVEVELGGGTSVEGDLTVENASDVEIEGCSAVVGTVTPADECD